MWQGLLQDDVKEMHVLLLGSVHREVEGCSLR